MSRVKRRPDGMGQVSRKNGIWSPDRCMALGQHWVGAYHRKGARTGSGDWLTGMWVEREVGINRSPLKEWSGGADWPQPVNQPKLRLGASIHAGKREVCGCKDSKSKELVSLRQADEQLEKVELQSQKQQPGLLRCQEASATGEICVSEQLRDQLHIALPRGKTFSILPLVYLSPLHTAPAQKQGCFLFPLESLPLSTVLGTGRYSCPLVSMSDWFQVPHGYQNPWMLRSLI